MSKDIGSKLSQKVRSGTRSQATNPLKRDRRDSHTRDIQHRDQPREDKADGPDFRSSASQGKSGVPSRQMIHSPTNLDKLGSPRRRGIRSSASRGKSGIPGRPMVHSPRNRDKRGAPHRRCIHRPGERGNWDQPNSLGIRRPLVDSPDIRKQDTDKREIRSLGSHTRRPGSRNRCPVVEEV